MAVLPVVRYLMVCEDVRPDPDNPNRVDLIGVTSAVRSVRPPPFPCWVPSFAVFIELTGCRGSVDGQVRLVDADRTLAVTGSPEHAIGLPDDPLEVVNIVFRLLKVRFDNPGLYWVQFFCAGQLLHQVPLLVR